MSYDLNIPWPINNYDKSPTLQQLTNLRNIIITNYSLGITHQVINFQISLESVKIPIATTNNNINPIPKDQLLNELLPKFPKLKLFTRLTLVVNDSSKLPQLGKLQNHFDIIALQPLNEKVLQLSILNLDIDLISINLSSKLSFYLKFKTLNNATEKGIKFEICYSQLISGNNNNNSCGGYVDDSINANLIKKNFFNNVLQLIRGCRSRGIIISSGAQNPLQLRNLSDILILLKTLSSSPLDLSKNNCQKFITINPQRVLINGKLKQKSYRQTIVVNNNSDLLQDNKPQKESTGGSSSSSGGGGGFKKKLDDTSSGRLLKKRKTK